MLSILQYCKDLQTVTKNEGEILLSQGSKSDKFYIIKHGECEILRSDFQINKISEPGSMLGEMSILLDNPHMATVRCTKDSEFYVVDNASDFLHSNKDITYHLAKTLAQRLNGVTSYLVDLKNQFEGRDDHFSMVDEVLQALVSDQDDYQIELGSERSKDAD